jgi:hypothetical protein
MISDYNTNAPGTSGKSGGGLGNLFTIAVVGLVLYLGYKYIIKEKPKTKE